LGAEKDQMGTMPERLIRGEVGKRVTHSMDFRIEEFAAAP